MGCIKMKRLITFSFTSPIRSLCVVNSTDHNNICIRMERPFRFPKRRWRNKTIGYLSEYMQRLILNGPYELIEIYCPIIERKNTQYNSQYHFIANTNRYTKDI